MSVELAGLGTAVASGTVWRQLREQLQGELVLPGDESYPQAKQLQQMEFDAQQPLAIAYCETAQDVSAAIRFGRRRELPLCVRSGCRHERGSRNDLSA